MKKRNGFTLIELLAVIVILAVIALIAVPRIIEILNKAKLSAAEDSTMGIVESAESYVASFMLQNQGAIPSENLIFECNSEGCNLKNILDGYNTENLTSLEFKGKKPTSGTIIVGNGGSDIITTNLNINNFTCLYSKGKSSCIEKQEIKENGTEVYFNPETGEQCSDSEYTIGQSNTENKTGCMKWYIFNDSNDSAVYTLIADHNITDLVAWNLSGTNYEGPKEVLEALKEATTTWSDDLISPIPYTVSWTYGGSHSYTIDYTTYGNKARLISAEEIAEITGASKSVDDKGIGWTLQSAWFYFDGADSTDETWHTLVANSDNKSKYAWLFDNTVECENYGCNVAQSGNYGYWTSSPLASVSSHAWSVNYNDRLNDNRVNNHDHFGVRPVITVKKSDLLQ